MISWNHFVVVKREKTYRVLKVTKDQVCIDKLRFKFDGSIGQRYGSCFAVKNHQLTVCDGEDAAAEESATANDDEPIKADNLNDTNGASANGGGIESVEIEMAAADNVVQQVSNEEIAQMKKDGTSSTTIVSKLVGGCNTFRTKSTFAQEKYVARKTKKHSNIVCLMEPTIRLLAEIYYRKDPEKISFIRIDNLSLILSMANVHYGAKVIVAENCAGLITAGVVERLGGSGICVNLHKGVQPQAIPAVAYMNFSEDISRTNSPIPLNDLMNDNIEGLTSEQQQTEQHVEKAAKRERRLKTLEMLNSEKFDAVIIACKYHPLEILQKVFPKLDSSRSFVLYSPYVQPLLDCFRWLRDEGTSVNLHLTDNFYRRYQVLPNRTHPEMNQNVVSGFVLSGLTVDK